jgi:hypothetical protein
METHFFVDLSQFDGCLVRGQARFGHAGGHETEFDAFRLLDLQSVTIKFVKSDLLLKFRFEIIYPANVTATD